MTGIEHFSAQLQSKRTSRVLAGPSDMSMLQLACEGRCADKVLPRLLLRVRKDALRYTPEEVP